MSPGGRRDPYLKYNFEVRIDGKSVGGFQEVTGLQAEIEFFDYREGGVNEYVHKLAGPVKYSSNLVLKWGTTDDTTLWGWYQNVMRGRIERKTLSVTLLDSTGQVKRTWNFKKAYPIKWVGSELRGGASEVAVETLEFAHRGLEA
jgi:phage tail-like protein